MKKIISIMVLIASYDICGFCLIHEFNGLVLLSWFAFTSMATLCVFVMTTKLIIMLLELPRYICIEYVSDLEPNK